MNPAFYEKLEAAGHVLYRTEDGDVNCWIVDGGYHNGPGCLRCGDAWCEHCDEGKIEPCTAMNTVEERDQIAKQELDAFYARVTDLLRRGGTEDAERLCDELKRRLFS